MARGGARRDPARPPDSGLIDSYGRRASDLRVSLTDRCNLRCSYCMPAEGLDWMPGEEVLTDAELIRLITIAVRDLGITELRYTGGEPLLRRGLESVIAEVAALDPRPEQSVTTNGLGLQRRGKERLAGALDLGCVGNPYGHDEGGVVKRKESIQPTKHRSDKQIWRKHPGRGRCLLRRKDKE